MKPLNVINVDISRLLFGVGNMFLAHGRHKMFMDAVRESAGLVDFGTPYVGLAPDGDVFAIGYADGAAYSKEFVRARNGVITDIGVSWRTGEVGQSVADYVRSFSGHIPWKYGAIGNIIQFEMSSVETDVHVATIEDLAKDHDISRFYVELADK